MARAVPSRKAAWMIVGTATAMAVGALVERALEAGWRRATEEDPPSERDIHSDRWLDAMAWTVASGAVVSVARLLARRGAAIGWRHVTGRRPPV